MFDVVDDVGLTARLARGEAPRFFVLGRRFNVMSALSLPAVRDRRDAPRFRQADSRT